MAMKAKAKAKTKAKVYLFMLSLILASLFVCSAFADYSNYSLYNPSLQENDNAISVQKIHKTFWTQDVPDDIDRFVQEAFTSYSVSELRDLGFSEREIISLDLFPAIIAYEYEKCDDDYYYYPVVSGNTIIAMITAFRTSSGDISVQFGKTKMADSLNKLFCPQESPAGLVISSNGLYVTYDGHEATPFMTFDNSIKYDKETLSIDADLWKNTAKRCIDIGEPKYIIASYPNKFALVERGIYTKTLSVPVVPNISIGGVGYCWAASLASIIKYIFYPSMTGPQLRDHIISNINNYTSNTIGTMECDKDVLNVFVFGHTFYCYYNGWDYYNFKASLDNDIPILSDWQRTGGAHAMVICGYYYNTSIPDSAPASRRITVMDPNETNYISIYNGLNYNNGTYTYYLYGTVR